jgi:hypothetical protein
MNNVYMRGAESKKDIENSLYNTFDGAGRPIANIKIIQILEQYDLDFDITRFNNVSELADIIIRRIEIHGKFESAFLLADEEDDTVVYLMFSKTNDPSLIAALSTI